MTPIHKAEHKKEETRPIQEDKLKTQDPKHPHPTGGTTPHEVEMSAQAENEAAFQVQKTAAAATDVDGTHPPSLKTILKGELRNKPKYNQKSSLCSAIGVDQWATRQLIVQAKEDTL